MQNTGLPWWPSGKESAWILYSGAIGSMGLISGLKDPLEKGMATHSSVLAWRIPWTEEPGELQSIGSKRVRPNWRDFAHTHMCNTQPTDFLEIFTVEKLSKVQNIWNLKECRVVGCAHVRGWTFVWVWLVPGRECNLKVPLGVSD